MKKVICFFLLIVLILFPAKAAFGEDNSIDIEKAAILAVKTSQKLQTLDKTIDNVRKQLNTAKATAESYKSLLIYVNGSTTAAQMVKAIVLTPIETDNTLQHMFNGKEVMKNGVRLTAYGEYVGLLKLSYGVQVQKELMNNLYTDYNNSKLQLEEGLISRYDARLIEINYLKSVYQYNSLLKNLESVYMDINNLMGLDISSRFTKIMDNNIIPAKTIRPLNDYIAAALTNRYEIIDAQNTLYAKKQEYEYGRAELPTDYELYCKQSEYDIDSAQNDLDITKLNVQLDITNGYKDLQNKMKALENMQAQYNLAESDYEAAEEAYNNSMITEVKYEYAKIAKANAQMNLKDAELDAWFAQNRMEAASGLGPGITTDSSADSSVSSDTSAGGSSQN